MHIFPYIHKKTAGCAGSRSLCVFDVAPPVSDGTADAVFLYISLA